MVRGEEKDEIVLKRERGMRERSESESSTKSLEELWGGKEKMGGTEGEKKKKEKGEEIFTRNEVTRRTLEKGERKKEGRRGERRRSK